MFFLHFTMYPINKSINFNFLSYFFDLSVSCLCRVLLWLSPEISFFPAFFKLAANQDCNYSVCLL